MCSSDLLKALEAHDAAALRTVLVAHLVNKRDRVLALMRAGEVYPQAAQL